METHLPITSAVVAAILALLGVVLTVRVILKRVKYRIDYADDGNSDLAQAIRAHANFVEQAPLAIIVLTFAEALGAAQLTVMGLGMAFVITRFLSAIGLSRSLGQSFLRQSSAGLTAVIFIVTSLIVLYLAFSI